MPQLDGQSELVWGRRVSVVLAVVIVSVCLMIASFGRGGIFEFMLGFAARVTFPMALPFFLVVFFRRAPRSAALFSIITGLVLPFLVNPLVSKYLGHDLFFHHRVLVVGCCSLFGYLLSYAVHFRESEEARALSRQFYEEMHRPVDFEKEIGEANDFQQLQMLGRLSLVVSVLMLVLLAVPNPFKDRLTILYMGGAVGVIGAILLWAAARLRRKQQRT